MDEHTLLTVMTVFVIVAAVALLIQAAMLAGIFMASRGLQQNVRGQIPYGPVRTPSVQLTRPV